MQMRPTLHFITRYKGLPSAKCLQLSIAPRPLTNGSAPPCAPLANTYKSGNRNINANEPNHKHDNFGNTKEHS